MNRSVDSARLRSVTLCFVLSACGIETIDRDAIEDGSRTQTGGYSSGGKARASGGNGLERPPGSGGRGVAAGGVGQNTASTGGAAGSSGGEAGVPASSGGTLGGEASGGRSSGAAGAVAFGGKGRVDTGGAGGASAGGSALGGDGAEPAPEEAPARVFFSEYVEGTSNNKALEIAATSDGPIDACSIAIYLNGATSPSRTAALSGRIDSAHPLVVCDPKFSELDRCAKVATLSFNGNDAVTLVCRGELMDSIGRIGEAPKQYWGTKELGTADLTLRRRCDIVEGDRDPNDPFDPASEWIAAGVDTFDDLGSHCAPAIGEGGAGGGSG